MNTNEIKSANFIYFIEGLCKIFDLDFEESLSMLFSNDSLVINASVYVSIMVD